MDLLATLDTGNNAWQLTAATLVGLMSVPGLVVLYGGVMQKRWSVNSMMMAFVAFAIVLILWVLFAFKMGFGEPIHGSSEPRRLLRQLLGQAGLDPGQLQPAPGRRTIPEFAELEFSFPQSTLAYFQIVFAAITPILMLGSVLGRINFKAWIPFVALWTMLVYTINAFLIWGGGYFAQQGAVDFSGGYVIHLAAGVSGFVAAAVIGPRLQRDREVDAPNNLAMVAVGAGLLWMGWNGFNGGDWYEASGDRLGGGAQHQPLHRGGLPGLGRLRLPDRAQAEPDRQRQRDDRRPRRDHPRRRLRQRLGRDHHRRDRRDDRLLRAQLPEPDGAVPQRRRHARRGLHARLRRSRRRAAGRHLRQQRRWRKRCSPGRSPAAGCTCSSGRR